MNVVFYNIVAYERVSDVAVTCVQCTTGSWQPAWKRENLRYMGSSQPTPAAQTLNFLVCFGVWPINNVVIVADEQWRHPDIYIYIEVSILPNTRLPFRLPHNIEQSSSMWVVLMLHSELQTSIVCPTLSILARDKVRKVASHEGESTFTPGKQWFLKIFALFSKFKGVS